MIIKKINRRNFLISLTTIIGGITFLIWLKPFSKNITLNKNSYFSSFCALKDDKEEFLSNYNLNNSKTILHNQTLLGPYFINTNELLSLKSISGKSL